MIDVIVVGSGGAGLVAALAAATSGARVTLLERAPVFGGTTAISGGGMWLPGNSAGAALGFEDSPEEVRTYLDRVTFGRVARPVLDAFVATAPEVNEFIGERTALVLDGTHVADYLTDLPGAKVAGRQVATGLYDMHRLGEWADKVRMGPWPGGIAFVTQHEKETFSDLSPVMRERMAKGVAGRGRALVAGLLEANLQCEVELVNDARVVGLLQSGGRVTGVEVLRNGQHQTLPASQGVILASGGFEWNRTLWEGLIGVPFDGPLSPPYNEGDGLKAAARVGAQLGNINQVWWMPSLQIPGETYDGHPRLRSAANRGLPGSIIVNRRGRRYGNESMNYNDFGKLQVAFDPHAYDFVNSVSFQIFDQAHLDRYPLLDSDEEPPREALVTCAPTLRALAETIGVDPDGLEEQVREFNRFAGEGRDPQFHRGEVGWERKVYAWERFKADDPFGPSNPTLATIEHPPYYAYPLKIGCFGTKGGVVIDERGQVVDGDNRPIPGLYAAGNVTAGVFGPAYPGGGSTLGPAAVFGYLAGRAVAAH
jgi:succinate dehydrogenase/fumarate reductase flavoprotein subunit